ncbi:MAG: hypothetical protein DRQ55_18770 [Planctomycetota bacterium]|nr:MAG: hypothetical protein DRQ55_18770 [Planctomycetota bacterium]
MKTATLLATTGLLAASPLFAQLSMCRLAPLEPAGGYSASGIDADLDWFAVRVQDSAQEWIEIRRKIGSAWLAADLIPSPDPSVGAFAEEIDIDVSPFGVEVMATSRQGSTAAGMGVVRRYLLNLGSWVELPAIRSSDPVAVEFGTHFARAGDVMVAKSRSGVTPTAPAQAHVFEPLAAVSWVETARIDYPDPNGASRRFGDAIAVGETPSGSLIAIASLEPARGRVWVWSYQSPGQLGTPFELIPSTPASNQYGQKVAIWNGYVAVSDPTADVFGTGGVLGAITLFGPSGAPGQFVEIARFLAPVFSALGFGDQFDFNYGRLVVPFTAPTFGTPATIGGLTVIDDLFGTPTYRLRVTEPNDPFGGVGAFPVFGPGEVLSSGVSVNVGNANQRSPAIVRFAVDPPTTRFCSASPNSSGAPARVVEVGCAHASSVRLLGVSLPSLTIVIPLLGTSRASLPVGSGTLCIGDPSRRGLGIASSQGLFDLTIDPTAWGFEVGDVVITQFWFRDGPGMNLSDAIAFELVP